MPRLPRLHVPGGYYHVTLRGNHRKPIFSTEEDRRKLNEIVAEALAKYEARLHAFCWMTNHLHAFIQVGRHPLGVLIKRIAMRYSRYRHKQLRTTGHLFDRRYRDKLVDADSYFVRLLRYIHRNPVAARMALQADDYPWSSHRVYLGIDQLSWVTTEVGLSYFGKTLDSARRQYKAMMDDVHVVEECAERWLPSRDPRVLGTDRFLASLPPPRLMPKTLLSLDELAVQICEINGITLAELKSPLKSRSLSNARVDLIRRATIERIATRSEIAQFLSRSPTAISRLVARHSN